MKIASLLRFIVIGGTLLTSGCICMPLLYEPTFDPAPLVMSLRVPEKIEPLSGIPRDKTVVLNGPDRKEVFRIERGSPSTSYAFSLCYNEQAAKESGERYKKFPTSLYYPPFFSGEWEDRAYIVYYTIREQSDHSNIWRTCTPGLTYISMATFRFRNLVVEIEIYDKKNNPDSMANAVRYLIDLLAKEWDRSGKKDKEPGGTVAE